ncbi:TIGR02611 family protein [Streptomyces sp. NPDC006475]|uniref:TIGR02611 family protein n=1 Tax=Streptomyces sp. NPDC006475 TaxID=3155719 RepID=UPI0033BC9AB3
MATSSNSRTEGAVTQAEGGEKPYSSKAPHFIQCSKSLHLIWRIGIFVAGFAVVGTGVILLPLPGPGWVVIFGGMAIWASEFTWAQFVLRWTKRKVTEATRRALQPEVRRRNIVLTSAALAVVAAAAGTLITHFGLLDRSIF